MEPKLCGWSSCTEEVPEERDFCSQECRRRFAAKLEADAAAYRARVPAGAVFTLVLLDAPAAPA